MLKNIIQVFLWLAPWSVRRKLLCFLYGYSISSDARIGYSIIRCQYLEMGSRSWIGHLTYIKEIKKVILGQEARIGNLNWVMGYPATENKHFSHVIERDPVLRIGNHSAITNRHLIDCTDAISIGDYSTVAGFRSQFLTHSIDVHKSIQNCAPIQIGDYCFVGTSVVMLGGAKLPDRSVLGALSILQTAQTEERCLYAGTPAKRIKNIDGAKYFERTRGFVN